jgi:hypothetical protein
VHCSASMGEGVSFHTFHGLGGPFVRLLVKNLGRGMPECVDREELEAMDIYVKDVVQLRSGRREKDPSKDRLLTPPFHCISGARA